MSSEQAETCSSLDNNIYCPDIVVTDGTFLQLWTCISQVEVVP